MLKTKYITLDEFQEYFPDINLRLAMGSEENAVAFLCRVEDRLGVFLDSNFNRNIDMEYPTFSEYQKEHYKKALLEQCFYIYRNSDVSTDSGYDTQSGIIVDRSKLVQLAIAENTKEHLLVCGLWNRQLRSNRTGRWFIGW